MTLHPLLDVRRFVKFSGVGIVGFLVDVSVLQSAVSAFGISPYVARLASYVAAASATWWLNRQFTFTDASRTAPAIQWARFLAVNAIGFSANYVTFAVIIATLPLAAKYPVLAVPFGSLAGLLFNFFLSKKFAFIP